MGFFNRISLLDLIKKHISTFYDDAYYKIHHKKRVPKSDIIIFCVLPVFFSLCLVSLKLFLTEAYLNIILTCLSIFAGLLFGLLPLVYELTKVSKANFQALFEKISEDEVNFQATEAEVKFNIAKELFVNISFTILIAFITIFFSLLTRFKSSFLISFIKKLSFYEDIKGLFITEMNALTYYFLTLFFLTILMILKRFYLLYSNETTL